MNDDLTIVIEALVDSLPDSVAKRRRVLTAAIGLLGDRHPLRKPLRELLYSLNRHEGVPARVSLQRVPRRRPMNITGAQLAAMEADGWVVASSVWTAAGNQCLLRRGSEEQIVTVGDEAGAVNTFKGGTAAPKASLRKSASCRSEVLRRLHEPSIQAEVARRIQAIHTPQSRTSGDSRPKVGSSLESRGYPRSKPTEGMPRRQIRAQLRSLLTAAGYEEISRPPQQGISKARKASVAVPKSKASAKTASGAKRSKRGGAR